MRFNELDQPSVGDILELELGDEIVEAVITAIEGDEIIAETDNMQGARLLAESYGKYYCSTDKKWKQRQGPKQTRESVDYEKSIPPGADEGRVKWKCPACGTASGIAAFRGNDYKCPKCQEPLPVKGQMGLKHQQGVAEAVPGNEYSRVLTALRLYYPRFEMEELNTPEWYRVIANKANVTPEYAGQVINDFVKASQPDEEENLDWMDDTDHVKEAEYQGRKVALGKPMQGDVKKFKVYVKDPGTGNVKKVNFGDPNMRIKKSNPARRKSFRARHNCSNPGPRTKARYWSCRKW